MFVSVAVPVIEIVAPTPTARLLQSPVWRVKTAPDAVPLTSTASVIALFFGVSVMIGSSKRLFTGFENVAAPATMDETVFTHSRLKS